MHESLRPASVTKVMSILLIMEQIDSGKLSYTDQIPCSENARSMGKLNWKTKYHVVKMPVQWVVLKYG